MELHKHDVRFEVWRHGRWPLAIVGVRLTHRPTGLVAWSAGTGRRAVERNLVELAWIDLLFGLAGDWTASTRRRSYKRATAKRAAVTPNRL